MGLTSAFQIGHSALTASQLAIQVAGNNLANAATPGYSRQIAHLAPMRGDHSSLGWSVGSGVLVRDVRRQIDEALQARLWSGISAETGAAQQFQLLAQVETALGELTDNDLSSELNAYFSAWSERANGNQSGSMVVQQGVRLAEFIQRVRRDLDSQRAEVDRQLGAQVTAANTLLSQIAKLNRDVADAEVGGSTANALRDQRDALVSELSAYLDVTAVEQPSGSVNILIGSTPVVLGTQSRGIELARETVNGSLAVSVAVKQDGQRLEVLSGSVGALLAGRESTVSGTIEGLDRLATQLIYQVNRLHSTGTNAAGLRTTTGTLSISGADRTLALNDPDNRTLGGLPFAPTNGGFLVQVMQTATGQTRTVRIDVDLDGRTAAGAPGYGDDTSAEDIRAALNAIDGLSATFTADGRLKIDAAAGVEFSFAEDTSGVLAVLGVNSFFQGADASDIAVRAELQNDPTLLATGRIIGGQFVENGTALELASLQDTALAGLGDRSLRASWTETVQALGVRVAAAKSNAASASLVRESLEAQRAGLSGVSVDEESLNLMTFQRQYQGAARFIAAVDEMTQVLINLV